VEKIMSIRKSADGKYQIDIYENGRKRKRVREIFYGTEQDNICKSPLNVSNKKDPGRDEG